MDPLLATLAVLVIGLGLFGFGLARRLDRMRTELSRLDRLDALDQRLEALAAQVEQTEIGAALQAKLTEFSEANLKLAAAMAELRQRLPAASVVKAHGGNPADVVGNHLARLGFEDLHVLTDIESLPEHTGRVVFEARRRGVLHKGYVELASGKVLTESIQSAYAAFP